MKQQNERLKKET